MSLIVSQPENTTSIIKFMTMVSIGTKVHITVNDSDYVYIHKVTNATQLLEFLSLIYKNEKHVLQVIEITTYQGDFEVGLLLKCI